MLPLPRPPDLVCNPRLPNGVSNVISNSRRDLERVQVAPRQLFWEVLQFQGQNFQEKRIPPHNRPVCSRLKGEPSGVSLSASRLQLRGPSSEGGERLDGEGGPGPGPHPLLGAENGHRAKTTILEAATIEPRKRTTTDLTLSTTGAREEGAGSHIPGLPASGRHYGSPTRTCGDSPRMPGPRGRRTAHARAELRHHPG